MPLVRLLAFGDNDSTPDAVKVNDAMMKVPNVSQYLFVGDGPYDKSGKKWTGMMLKSFGDKKDKMMWSRGNHDCVGSESKQTQVDIEQAFPEAKSKVVPGTWCNSKQIGNVYTISMDTEDLDVEFERDQYKWVTSELAKAKQLRQSGKIDWIVMLFHKPFFTLKSSHSPYVLVRYAYMKQMRDAQVDFCISGHNHNTQLWYPMIPNQKKVNGEGTQLFKYASDKKTFDFTQDHGAAYIVSGHAGHEWNPIDDKGPGVKNVMHQRSSGLFGFTQLDFNGKKANIQSIDVTGKIHFQYNVTREGGVAKPKVTTPPEKPTSPPPKPGMVWDPTSKQWKPKLEDAAFVPKGKKVVTPPQPQTPTPQVGGVGQVIWTSKGIWDNGKDRTFDSTDPDDPNSQMRAGEGRSCHVDGKGTAYFSGQRGRMYWYRNNYDFIMQFDMIWNPTIDNIGLRGRSRHNEGGSSNDFGGYGANYSKAQMDFKSEDSHSGGGGVSSETFKYPTPFEDGKLYGIRFQLKDNPKPNMTFSIDYKDGKGWVKVGDYTDQNPAAFRVDRKAFEEISYLWLRTNNQAGMPKDYAVSNVVILETSGMKQSGNKGADYGTSSDVEDSATTGK